MGVVIADQHKKPETSSTGPPSNTAASDFQKPAGRESLEKGKNIVEHGDGARVRQTTPLSEDFGDILAGNPTDSALEAASGMSRVLHLATEGEETSNSKHSGTSAPSFMGPMVNVNRSDKKTRGEPFGTPFFKLVGRAFQKQSPMVQLEGIPVKFSYKQLSVATGGFSEQSLIGEDGFGNTYLGVLPSGIRVAVKRLKSNSIREVGDPLQWQPEVSLHGQLKHRNVVELLGWCDGGSSKLKESPCLVFEFMPNGSLKNLLVNPVEGKAPSWSQRFNILDGTAAALDYLHSGWKYEQQVIHRDVKCANIMLDEEYNAKLGDFGIARVVPHGIELEEDIAGTVGYIDPQYCRDGKFSSKVDVYSFGVVVLEVVCAQPAWDHNRDPVSVVKWVWQRLEEGDLMKAVDRRLEDYDTYWVEVVLKIGLLCTLLNSEARPSMRQVVRMLAGDIPVPRLLPSKDRDTLSADTDPWIIPDPDLLSDPDDPWFSIPPN